jgi:hypothetical protein
LHGGEGVGDGKAEIVMAMRGKNDALCIHRRDALPDFGKHRAVFLGR